MTGHAAPPEPPERPDPAAEARARRLAEALRVNLARRKAQRRARAEAAGAQDRSEE